MTISTPLITVFGATGNQGGAVAKSLLKNPSFKVRALTRNPDSAASQALAAQGAQIQQANGFSSESMLEAFRGSWGVFVNINSDDKEIKSQGLTEFDLGRTIVDAAAEAGVRHFIFSTGPDCHAITQGKVKMNAADSKYKIEQYARQIERFESVSFICAAWFLENFLVKEMAPIFGGFPHVPDSEGFLTFVAPKWGGKEDVPFVSIADDFGDIVQGMLLDPLRWNGQVIHGCSDICSFEDLVSGFEKLSGQKSRFQPLPSWEDFDTHGIPELQDTKMMFGFTQNNQGRYFGPEPSEKNTASELKRVTALALGQPVEAQKLTTAGEWFQKYFQFQ
ncbi:NmrA/HSCARG family protein [Aspergillus clavatus NRRL 1]|uniref:NmrA family transcriptional regulator, putative n=1 Tax=Aspergillus clavatus (strain ATCC 1007 / CBS 513.65 / DSM 816 / NCTC 3887 / NRRL 1 / QM 1276 / 107) TaxID=344612 RepID=A1C4F8_ASPCL|nr:NmrA family transcriptional regulator, putative [Aspergillus clavatus NRRL 1]EAW15298.1 NmrA family transcriptional regulator, putative [Aspergillus clavatus NRRL 1]